MRVLEQGSLSLRMEIGLVLTVEEEVAEEKARSLIASPRPASRQMPCSSRRFLARRWRGTNVGGLLEVGGEGAFLGPFPEFGERFEALGIVL